MIIPKQEIQCRTICARHVPEVANWLTFGVRYELVQR